MKSFSVNGALKTHTGDEHYSSVVGMKSFSENSNYTKTHANTHTGVFMW